MHGDWISVLLDIRQQRLKSHLAGLAFVASVAKERADGQRALSTFPIMVFKLGWRYECHTAMLNDYNGLYTNVISDCPALSRSRKATKRSFCVCK
jgi:hypothetical protein